MNNKPSAKTLELVQLALFAAIIIVMASVPFLGYIPLPFTRATILHVPVIIGCLMFGPKKGAILGALFGLTSLVQATFNPNLTSFAFSPFYSLGDVHGNFWSLVICFVPRILVGIVPYYVYQLFRKLFQKIKGGQTFSLILAGLAGSLVNTLLVMNFIYLFFGKEYAAAKEITTNLYGVILGVIVANGIPEAIVAAILTTAICKALFRIRKMEH
ncbi:MAG: ECF transporter S component [Candidatus Merdivicinus sp.]|jgi:uncharacterized membrane protein